MSKKTRNLVAISFVIGLTIFFHYLGWLVWLENFMRGLIRPVSQTMYEASAGLKKIEDSSSLIKNKVDLAQKKLLEDENSELRSQLNFLQKHSWQTVGGEVIGRNVDTLGSTIIINRGGADSLAVGDPVIVGEGLLVGRVVKVEKTVAIVRLINDNQSKVAATVINKDKSLGLVEGGYGISIYLNYVPQNEQLNVGDIIVTSGLEEKVPKGLLIGTVETAEKEAYQPFQKAVLSPLVDLNKITLVSIIIAS
jgi:rod shape-determining protein MreC